MRVSGRQYGLLGGSRGSSKRSNITLGQLGLTEREREAEREREIYIYSMYRYMNKHTATPSRLCIEYKLCIEYTRLHI